MVLKKVMAVVKVIMELNLVNCIIVGEGSSGKSNHGSLCMSGS